MEGTLRGFTQAPGDFTLEAVRAVREIEALGHDPIVIGYHPISRMNPFLALLYQNAWQAGVGAIHVIREETFGELTHLASAGLPIVLHLHWLNQVLASATTKGEARRDREAFLGMLDRFLDAGGRLAWTVHNIVPHGTRIEDEEARLSQDVVDRSSVVHVMAERTPEIVRPWYRIPPEKILQVPHPSYLGAYEDVMTREQARHELGLWADEVVYVILGAIRPYKGLRTLLDTWPAAGLGGRPRRLVIAGAPTEEDGIAEVLEQAALERDVLLHAGAVEPSDVQVYLRAADVAVLPYVKALNSGAQLLAMTFGLPLVVPADGALADVADERFARSFAVDDQASLAAALREAAGLATPEARAAALEVATRLAPGPISLRFGTGLRELLARNAGG
jgi:beta-1,4-mannosyltransferase